MGFISLICFTFFITEKTTMVIKNVDEIMIEIKENMDNYNTQSKNAIIEDNKIIPGLSSRKVNANRSYKNMKLNGYYSEELYSFDYVKPKISLENNKDKYIISGNPSKKMISLVFLIKDKEDISKILNTLSNFNTTATFFVNENNYDDKMMKKIVEMGNNIGLITEDMDSMDLLLKKIQDQKNVFCLNEEYNDSYLKSCYENDNYTVVPEVINNSLPLSDIKKKAKSGGILEMEVTRELKKELSTIIIHLKSKGYSITNLENNVIE